VKREESVFVWVRIYDALFKVIPLDKPELKAFNIRISELLIYDIQAGRSTVVSTTLHRHFSTDIQ
jgi:hypothetical protein